jgi:hypothetical protein
VLRLRESNLSAAEKPDEPTPASTVANEGQERRKFALVVFLVFTVILLLAFSPLVPELEFGITSHYACVPTNAVATQAFATPVLIINSPYGEIARGNTSVPASWLPPGTTETLSTSASNGSSAGIFEVLDWTLYNASTQVVIGPGLNVECSGAYLAQLEPSLGHGTLSESLSGNITSTNGKVSAQETKGYSFAEFQDEFANSSISGSFSNCAAAGAIFTFSVGSSSIPVQIPFIVGSKVIYVNSTVDWNQHYEYLFSNPGSWLLDNLTRSMSGTGFAFSYKPCT